MARPSPLARALAAIALVAGLAACDNDQSTDTTIEPTTTTVFIEHLTNPAGIVVQIGDYDGAYSESAVLGPTLVVYGDGTVYLETPRTEAQLPQFFTGVMPEASLQVLLRAAVAYEPTPRATDVPADMLPTVVIVGGLRWSRYVGLDDSDPAFDALLQLVRSTALAAATTPWVPERWIVRDGHGDCTVTAVPAASDFDDAPVYPHALDRFPLGPVEGCR